MTREQFITLVKDEQAALRRFLLTLCCGNSDDADDLAQEVLVKAYLSSASFHDCNKFKAWLYKIAYNTFISSRRIAKLTVPIDETPDVADLSLSADRRYRYQHLYAALATLSPKERSTLVLFYLNGRSIKEISKIAETNEATVRQQQSRGRTHLRQIMTDYGKV